MATPIVMPKQGNSVEECLLVAWKKQVGDTVAAGEAIAEMETDKASFELEAPAAGKILALFAAAGELVPVLTNVGVIGDDGENTDEFKPKQNAAKAPGSGNAAAALNQAAPQSSPAVPAAETAAAVTEVAATLCGFASPRARQWAAARNFDYSGVVGTGAQGRIVEKDVQAAYYAAPRRSGLARQLLAEGYEETAAATGAAGLIRGGDLRKGEPLSNIRKVIAARMSASLKNHAQLTLNSAADATVLLAARARLKSRTDVKITVGDLIMFAVIKALEVHPEINCEYVNGKVYPGKNVNIAFACDTPKGLLVPVLHAAEKMSIAEMAAKVKTLAADAISGNINPDYLEGGTFTVSNLGAFGVESFTPILNAPQVAILGVCAPVVRPVRADGQIKFRDYLGLSLTIDHQVIDGAPGAKFLQTVCANIAKIDEIAGV